MDKIQLLRLAQMLVLRADTMDIMYLSGCGMSDSDKIKFDLVRYLMKQEENEMLLSAVMGEDAK